MPPRADAWHALTAQAVRDALASPEGGLTDAEALARLARVGANALPPAPRPGALLRFARQFHNVLIYVLLVAAAITALLGHAVDSAVIAGVVVINALIGFIQEGRAEAALDAIRDMLAPRAAVLREGRVREIDATRLVPGDVVELAPGDRVPADLRLLRARSLRVDESALTGESIPVDKRCEALPVDTELAARANLTYAGTLVAAGQGAGVVVATGVATELGRIAQLARTPDALRSPLTVQMEAFARVLALAILVASLLVLAFGWRVRGYAFDEMFLAAVGIAVAAIPEGLPAIMTITLALGVQRMARRNAIVRRLPAVETLGEVSAICTDKTGTLTCNQMTVQQVVTASGAFDVRGEGYAPHGDILCTEGAEAANAELAELARAGLLCNDARLVREGERWRVEGDPTEGALLTLAAKAGLDGARERYLAPRHDTLPFDAALRYMASLHHDRAGHAFLYLKGAPEEVLARCTHERRGGTLAPLDHAHWRAHLDALAGRGQRVLAFAWRAAPAGCSEIGAPEVDAGYALLGLAGIIDPPRPEARAAIAACHAAGIRVAMITGDHTVTARAIASELGLPGDDVLDGRALDALDDAGLRAAARRVCVFARVSPEHKLRLVRALQAEGGVVAMTGDGVNDAPALACADVGVAMGIQGTEAAREAAQVVLADDNFATIAAAVEQGRTIHDNLRKAIAFVLPTNGGEALVIVAAILFGLTLPITAAQILWVNMVTAITLALALAFEPAEGDVMRRPPRPPHAPLVDGFMAWRVVFVSLLLVPATLGVFEWELARGVSLAAARTAAVNALVFAQIGYLFNSRRLLAPATQGLFDNRVAWAAAGVLVMMQFALSELPWLQRAFGTAALDARAWGLAALAGLAVCALVEFEKALLRRRAG